MLERTARQKRAPKRDLKIVREMLPPFVLKVNSRQKLSLLKRDPGLVKL